MHGAARQESYEFTLTSPRYCLNAQSVVQPDAACCPPTARPDDVRPWCKQNTTSAVRSWAQMGVFKSCSKLGLRHRGCTVTLSTVCWHCQQHREGTTELQLQDRKSQAGETLTYCLLFTVYWAFWEDTKSSVGRKYILRTLAVMVT